MENTKVLIRCDGLVKIYKTMDVEVFALQGLDLTINEGELLAIIGKSGSGKSTLLSILGLLDTPTAGKLFIDDENIFNMGKSARIEFRRKNFGYVWQDSVKNLLPYLTASENVEIAMFGSLSSKEKKDRAYYLLDKVGLKGKEEKYPGQMSGGERQRVAIATALCNNPRILLADEPTGAVDSRTSDRIQDLFASLNRELGITVIIVTHDMKLADRVDRTVLISDGKISTEKIRSDEKHSEYSVLDRAGRVRLSEEILSEAGIDGNRVKIEQKDGRIIITGI